MDNALNTIVLQGTMLEILYQHSLVDLPASGPIPAIPFRYLGSNAKNVIVVVNHPDHPFLSEAQLVFLTRMLEACRLNMGDIALINLVNGLNIDHVLNHMKPDKLIAFGVNLSGGIFPEQPIQPSLSPDSPFALLNLKEFVFLNVPSLDAVSQDTEVSKAQKAKLWTCLKELFSV